MTTLRDARVLITGGARGIGFALAGQFVAEGAEVILTDVDEDALEGAVDELRSSGGRCHSYGLDVTDREAILIVREAIVADHGSIDVLVNNAGISYGGPFLEVPIERHLKVFSVNIEGVVAVTHAFLPQLIAAPRSHLVNMASASGFVTLPRASTYASSKWAVIGFSESIRRELELLGHHHVGVTTVCPSLVDTRLFVGAKPPLLTKLLTPERLARKVIDAIKADQVMVLEPWMVKLTPFLANALPRRASDRLADVFGVTTSMNTYRGR